MIPKSIWKIPQKMAASAMESITSEMLPLLAVQAPVTRVAVTTVMGPVGPEIWLWVPPKREAKNPRSMAPVRPT